MSDTSEQVIRIEPLSFSFWFVGVSKPADNAVGFVYLPGHRTTCANVQAARGALARWCKQYPDLPIVGEELLAAAQAGMVARGVRIGQRRADAVVS